MPQPVTASARGRDVRTITITTILPSTKMLCRALKMTGLLYGDAVEFGERLWRVLPHSEAAVTAFAVLAGESGLTVLFKGGHGRRPS